MGAVDFSLSPRLIATLKRALPIDAFVETGTFQGDSLANAVKVFGEAHSVELSPEYHAAAVARFRDMPNVHIELADSPVFLRALRERLAGRPVLYFLDAHWCVAENTAGEKSQCPLLAEIGAIGELHRDSVVLIDDARLFLAPPPAPHDVTHWPAFEEIDRALRAAGPDHEIMVVNDVIAFYPRRIHEVMKEYARSYGVDWLRASQALHENAGLRDELDAREAVIDAVKAEKDAILRQLQDATSEVASQGLAIAKITRELQRKQGVIKDLHVAVKAYKATFSVFGFLIWPLHWLILTTRGAARRLRRLVLPRLGVLNQHPPVEMALPAYYTRMIKLTSPPRISIVTPSFRQAAFIERTIRSVLAQEYPDLEYVVQDGGSEDGTREILQSYSARLSSWEARPDSGQTEAINRGFARTTGEIMAWLNSDDVLLPGALAYVADHFMRHPEVDVVYGHRILIDENDRQIGRWIMPPHSDEVLTWADFVPQETMFFRRRIWDKVGARVDESFRFAMDWDLLLRFRDAGARFERLPRFIGGFRIHPHQKTSAVISDVGFQEMNRLRLRVLGRIPTGMEIQRAVLPYLIKHVATDLRWAIQNRLGVRA